MNNMNPMQLLSMLKINSPQQVATQIINQNFSSDPLMLNLLKMAESGNEQGLKQFASNFFKSQGSSLEKEMTNFMNMLQKN